MRFFYGFFCLISFFLDFNYEKGEIVLVINLIRHGARTPVNKIPELEKYFSHYNTGSLTYNGWRQQIMLGKYIRKHYIDSKILNFNINDTANEFLLFSSPYSRTIDTSIAYTLGLFPGKDYIVHNYINQNNITYNNINKLPFEAKDTELIDNIDRFNIVLPDKYRDILFHGRKCRFKEIDYVDKNDVSELITNQEKQILYKFLKENFYETFKYTDFNNLTESSIKSIHSAIKCANFNYEKEVFAIKDLEIEKIFDKFIVKYYYEKKLSNDNTTRLVSSQFFDHIIKFFDYKIENKDFDLNFYNLTSNNTDLNLNKLKLITYSGHDINIIGFIKNILDQSYLQNLINNNRVDILAPPFASNIELQLIKYKDGYYVKIIYNGIESIVNVKQIDTKNPVIYKRNKGIMYDQFKRLLLNRIYPDFNNCDFKKTMTFDED